MAAASSPSSPSAPPGAAFALLAMGVVYFFSFFQRIAIPGTLFNELHSDPILNAQGEVSASAITTLGSIYLGIYAVVQIFIGYLTDRFGGARVLLWGGLLLAVGALFFPLAATTGELYAARALVGIGASGMYLAIVKEITLLYPPRRFSAVLGACIFVGYSGGFAATYPLERAVRALGWREAMFGVGVLTALSLVAALWALRRSRAPAEALPFNLAGFRSACNRRTIPLLAVAMINFTIYFAVLSTIGKKCLQDVAGLASDRAAIVASLMSVASIVAVPAGGHLIAWAGERRKPFAYLGCGLTLAAVLGVIGGIQGSAVPWLIVAGYITFAVAQVANIPLVTLLKELVPPGREGLAIGALNSLCYVAAALSVNAAGLFLDRHRAAASTVEHAILYPPRAYTEFFLMMAALAIASFVLVFFVPETRGRNLADDTPPAV